MTTRYHIKGALRDSGRDTVTVIEAETKEVACRMAMDRGILVSAVTKLPESKVPRQTDDPQEPQLRFEVLGIASIVLKLAGVLFIIIGLALGLRSLQMLVWEPAPPPLPTLPTLPGMGIVETGDSMGWVVLGISASTIMAGVILVAFGGLIEVLRTIECNQRKLLSAKEAPP